MDVITREQAAKVLEIVDAGLVSGIGSPEPGQLCVEAAVCLALGLPHGDEPPCVAPTVRAYKIALNDAAWSSSETRAKGMRRLALAQLGSVGALDEVAFVQRLASEALNYSAPLAAAAGLAAAERAAEAVGWAAAEAAEWAAEAVGWAAEAARDKVLADHAERVVQILIDMEAPGCAFLDLAPLEVS